MEPVYKALFATDIAKAQAAGMTHWAKATCCPVMRFGRTLAAAQAKARRDAKRLMEDVQAQGMPPSVASGALDAPAKHPAAVALGRLAAGKPKHYTAEERARRAEQARRMTQARVAARK
jgi:hypothetical protein